MIDIGVMLARQNDGLFMLRVDRQMAGADVGLAQVKCGAQPLFLVGFQLAAEFVGLFRVKFLAQLFCDRADLDLFVFDRMRKNRAKRADGPVDRAPLYPFARRFSTHVSIIGRVISFSFSSSRTAKSRRMLSRFCSGVSLFVYPSQ
jgi:hypothetical protein